MKSWFELDAMGTGTARSALRTANPALQLTNLSGLLHESFGTNLASANPITAHVDLATLCSYRETR